MIYKIRRNECVNINENIKLLSFKQNINYENDVELVDMFYVKNKMTNNYAPLSKSILNIIVNS